MGKFVLRRMILTTPLNILYISDNFLYSILFLKMEFKTIFEVLLSENKYTNYRVARIIHMNGTTKRNGVPHRYSLIRLEISALEDKKVPTSIQLANKDFD